MYRRNIQDHISIRRIY